MGSVLWTAGNDLGWKPLDVGWRERVAADGPWGEWAAALVWQRQALWPDAGEGRALGGACA